jgi:hypothetical protein
MDFQGVTDTDRRELDGTAGTAAEISPVGYTRASAVREDAETAG